MRCTLASLAILALAAAPALADVVDTGHSIDIIGDGKKTFNKTLPKLSLPAVRDMKKPLMDDVHHLTDRVTNKTVTNHDEFEDKWNKAFMRILKLTEPLTDQQALLKNKTQDALTAWAAWKEDARQTIQDRINEKQRNEAKHEESLKTLKTALDENADQVKADMKTVKDDMVLMIDKTMDSNAKAQSELVDAAFGGKVKVVTTKAKKKFSSWDDDAADGGALLTVSEKFTKPDLIEVTGNKTLTWRI